MTENTNNNWGDFFKDNPSKVLGTSKKVKGRWGDTIITESEENGLDKIEVETNYRTIQAENPLVSVEQEDINENTITEEGVEDAVEVIEKSKSILADIIIAEEEGVDTDKELWTFDEIDSEYNKGISDDEKSAYIYYIQKMSEKQIFGGFEKYKMETTKENAIFLMKKGVLFYDVYEKEERRRWQPKFLYQSGNIYDKKAGLTSKKDYYIEQFGEEIYNIHLNAIEDKYIEVWDKRLTLDNPIHNMRLKILAISDMAKEFIIKEFIPPQKGKAVNTFRTNFTTSKGEVSYDMTKNTNRNVEYLKELNLQDAFIKWLEQGGNPQQSLNLGIIYRNYNTFQKIYDWYVRGNTKNMSNSLSSDKKKAKDQKNKLIAYAKADGERLFAQFLSDGITTDDRRRLELLWNSKYNGIINYDTNDVPIGFQFSKWWSGNGGAISLNDIRPEKREAIGFSMVRGSSLLAYGVGIGKTFASIFVLAQNLEMGLTKRPLVAVPNQVYTQFKKSIENILPQYKLNALYNCTGIYGELAKDISDYTISICTYQGLEKMGFSEDADSDFLDRVGLILENGSDSMTERQKEIIQQKHEEMLGVGKEGTTIEVDNPSVNFDYLVCDEAHNFKKLFTSVKGDAKPSQTSKDGRVLRDRTSYSLNSGVQSSRAIKLFFLTQYIQATNPNGNILLLTATPFTNSPLEVYSMLTFLNYNYLRTLDFGNIKNFFDIFADIKLELTLNTKLKPVRKQVFVGWNNVIGLQNLIFKFIDKSTPEQEEKSVKRPNKLILPLRSKMVNDKIITLSDKNKISTTLQMTDEQKILMDRLREYAEMKISWNDLSSGNENVGGLFGSNGLGGSSGRQEKEIQKLVVKYDISEEDALLFFEAKAKAKKNGKRLTFKGFLNLDEEESEALGEGEVVFDEDEVQVVAGMGEDKEKTYENAGVRALQMLSYSRQLAVSPYLYGYAGITSPPTASEYVESSPKLLYTFECIKSIKKHHKDTDTYMSGQVVYMNIGKDAFTLLLKYAVDELGFAEHEVGMITGSNSRIGGKKATKSEVQNAFQGAIWNEETQDFEPISDEKRLKILFGSSAIKEGINLQDHASVLYNCYLDFNPTDNIQLEGRIWRQGNKFANVRIVVPLMENSMDIFMFQKLQEKTERINQIWQRDGATNEINTTDFNPSELKYELLTDPITLAKLEVEDREVLIDEKIDDLNFEFNALNNFKTIYDSWDNILGYNWSLYNSKLYGMYQFLQAFRPDLVPLKFIKDEFLNLQYFSENSHKQLDDKKVLNYSASVLMDKMVQLHKEKKIAYPTGYTKDWESKPTHKRPIMLGDEVEFDTKKGRKKGKVSAVYNAYNQDMANEYDNDRLIQIYDNSNNNPQKLYSKVVPLSVDIEKDDFEIEDVNIDGKNVVRIEKEVKKKEKEDTYEPFTWGTKEAISKILDISRYQERKLNGANLWNTEALIEKIIENGDNNLLSLDKSLGRKIGFRIWNNEDASYFSHKNLQEWLEKNKKWIDLTDALKNTSEGYGAFGGFWNSEMPLILKKIEKGEKEFLKPKGIKDQQDLLVKMEELKSGINILQQDKKDLTDEENINEMAQEIAHKIMEEKEKGIRKSGGYKQRAKEFADTNADYLGNKLLDEMYEKADKKASTPKNEKVKETPKKKVPKTSSKSDGLEKRLKGLNILIKLAKGDSKAQLEKRKKGIEMLIKVNG